MRRIFLLAILTIGWGGLDSCLGQTPRLGVVASPRIHDPSTIVGCKGRFWMFATGPGVRSFRSDDLKAWTPGPRVFEHAPDWAGDVAAEPSRQLWAPDVVERDGRYLLYYSVSAFGRNTSAIGLATSATLDPHDPAFRWEDRGIVVQSRREDRFNAIDPAVVAGDRGTLWLAFGSFWDGIKLIELDPKTGLRIAPDSPIHALARKEQIEAPAIVRRGGWYHLFVNWGFCCRGVRSTYSIRVGRSRDVTGPYLDRDGVDLAAGGGTALLATDGPFIGPGHAGVLEREGRSYLSHHYYDGDSAGLPRLAVRPLAWDAEGWPSLED
ncbi:arabinan endo-1,5-alpha-L-arabinosidase [Paludisphaera mucosa]|uniref:Arabinan endo-1,5-alpha-L-arabinosidase n=1 Tax=Paludisphaera mucosa TaxID=3030827 RepID=A0ABT6FAH6_9BACT|nr:arabinan endo-1,5-alpha-L-arabinosidase [Paludisphaera mucosa]